MAHCKISLPHDLVLFDSVFVIFKMCGLIVGAFLENCAKVNKSPSCKNKEQDTLTTATARSEHTESGTATPTFLSSSSTPLK